jgi:hypothetical protein
MRAIWRAFSFYLAPLALLAALIAIVAIAPRGCVGSGGRMGVTASPSSSPETLPAGILVQPGAILGGQALRIGEAINPGTDPSVSGLQRPVGSFLYTRDGTQSFVKTGTIATDWQVFSVGGAAPTTSRTDFLTKRAATLTGISTTTLTCFHDDFVYTVTAAGGSTIYSSLASGSGIIGPVTTAQGGQLLIGSGASANSFAILTSSPSTFGPPGTQRFYLATRMQIVTAIDAQAIAVAGLQDTGFGKSIMLGICGNSSTANYVLQYDANSDCTGTFLNTGVPFVTTTLTTFELWGRADGKIHAAINFTEIPGSPVTPVSMPISVMRLAIDVRNGTTVTSRTASADYVHACWSEP